MANVYLSRAQDSANKLTKAILVDKTYAPGAKIPNESQLSAQLSISRTSVREAVKILIANGLLEIHRGVGTFVTDDPSFQKDPLLGLYAGTPWRQAYDALKLRLVLEPEMAKLATDRATKEDLKEIITLEQECKTLIADGKDYTYADHSFHKAIAKASHNAVYEKLLPMLHLSITIVLRSEEYSSTQHLSKENAVAYHKMLVDCMQGKDSMGAAIAIKNHIYNAITYLKMHEK